MCEYVIVGRGSSIDMTPMSVSFGWLVGLSVIISKKGGEVHFRAPIRALSYASRLPALYASLLLFFLFYSKNQQTNKKTAKKSTFPPFMDEDCGWENE